MGELIHQQACMYMDAFSLAQSDDVTTAMTAYQQVSEICPSSQYILFIHPLHTMYRSKHPLHTIYRSKHPLHTMYRSKHPLHTMCRSKHPRMIIHRYLSITAINLIPPYCYFYPGAGWRIIFPRIPGNRREFHPTHPSGVSPWCVGVHDECHVHCYCHLRTLFTNLLHDRE